MIEYDPERYEHIPMLLCPECGNTSNFLLTDVIDTYSMLWDQKEKMCRHKMPLKTHLTDATTVTCGKCGHQGDVDGFAFSDRVVEVPVKMLPLSTRTLNCLLRAGIRTVGDTLRYEDEELLMIRTFGATSLSELRTCTKALCNGTFDVDAAFERIAPKTAKYRREQSILEAYEGGMPVDEIMSVHGAHRSTVKWLVEHDISCRKRKEELRSFLDL